MEFKRLGVEDKQTLLEHLAAFRKAIVISVLAIGIAALISFAYSEQLLNIVTLPLSRINQRLIVTGVTEAFFVKLELAFLAGFILAFPIVAWAIWGFIKPALHPHERKYIYILLPATIILFAMGVLFAYFAILPMIMRFFVYIAGANLQTMFKVDQYVDFVMSFTIPFGIVFEMPVVTFFLAKMGIIKAGFLAKNRKYALLIIVILAGALTPSPDPLSQIMMAVPLYLLYEISIIVAKYAKPVPKVTDAEG
jgi:sec-independent protein translocase protein TatC